MRWMIERKEDEDERNDNDEGMDHSQACSIANEHQAFCQVGERTRNDRVRDPGRRIGRLGHRRDHALQAEARRALERHRRRDQWAVTQILRDEAGQSTIEFAIVTAAFVGILVALGLLHDVLTNGLVLDHVLASASHHLQDAPAPFIADIFKY